MPRKRKDPLAHLRTPAIRAKAAAAARATHARKRAEAAALAAFSPPSPITSAPYPSSAEPTLRVSQMAEFVVALVDAARRERK
jgi:hypothetical protein